MPDRSEGATPEPWRAFLTALDQSLGAPVTPLYRGLRRYPALRPFPRTADLDILAAVPHDRLADLQRVAGAGSALHHRFKVYLQPVPIAMYPEDYETRLIPMCTDLGLGRLGVFGLEAHDLALTKLERSLDKDRLKTGDLVLGFSEPTLLKGTRRNTGRIWRPGRRSTT